MAVSSGQICGDVIDAIRPDLEAFASLWSALRTNYQGTNITKTVARLLHLYQPEDGVLAYERLLRTLYILLEDFNDDGLRLLVSMVPPPKGVPDEIIERVFHKATGFARLNAPIFHRNLAASDNTTNLSNAKVPARTSQTLDSNAGVPPIANFCPRTENTADDSTIIRAVVKQDVPRKSNKSPKIPQRDPDVFRGFPLNEITNTQSHARNMTHLYRPPMHYTHGYPTVAKYVDYRRKVQSGNAFAHPRGLDPGTISSGYRIKFVDAPMLVRKNDAPSTYPDLILKTADNKFIRLPITKINGPPIANYTPYNSSQLPYQTFCANGDPPHSLNETGNKIPDAADFRRLPNFSIPTKTFETKEESCDSTRDGKEKSSARIPSRIDIVDHDYECTKSDGNFEQFRHFEAPEGPNENSDSPNEETLEKFRDAVKSRQRAIQEDIFRMDVVRCDRDSACLLESPETTDGNAFLLRDELKLSVNNFLKRAQTEKSLTTFPFPRTRELQKNCKYPSHSMDFEKSTEKSGLPVDKNTPAKSSSPPAANERLSNQKTNLTTVNEIQSNCFSKWNENSLERNNTSQKVAYATRILGNRNFYENTFATLKTGDGRADKQETDFVSTKNQKNTMVEMANYKKQYYEALLSIQRAKVAVANSLAISSAQTSSQTYDPRIFHYLQQQHQLLQQQQSLLMSQQHVPSARQPIAPPDVSNIRGHGMWIRSDDWKCSPCGRYTLPHHQILSSYSPQAARDEPKNNPLITGGILGSSQRVHRVARPMVKRRKLEEIIGTLKNSEKSNEN